MGSTFTSDAAARFGNLRRGNGWSANVLSNAGFFALGDGFQQHTAKVKATQSERELLGINKPITPVRRNLTEEQQIVITRTIKERLANDLPTQYPCWRTVRVIASRPGIAKPSPLRSPAPSRQEE